MAFQRSYSKVWWGSDNQMPAAAGSSFTSGGFYSYNTQQQQNPHQQQQITGNASYHSLDYNNFKSYSANLSRIQEVDDEHNISKLSWQKHDSPGSLRSQDSGFSDNDESHSTRSLGGRSSKTSSPSSKSDISAQSVGSPTSVRTIATPPTVIRRVGKTEFYSPLVSVTRRISFTGSPNSKEPTKKAELNSSFEEEGEEVENGATLMAHLDSMQLVSSSPEIDDSDASPLTPTSSGKEEGHGAGKSRRRRRVSRKATKPLTPTKRRTLVHNNDESDENDDADDDNRDVGIDIGAQEAATVPEYNNETVYLGAAPQTYNNETIILGGLNETESSSEDTNNNTLQFGDDELSPLKGTSYLKHRFTTASTSTPKALKNQPKLPQCDVTLPAQPLTNEYENPLLNGHTPALQSWLDDIRGSYEHEVMSTLQTKSIAQEAFKNLTITTNTVAKLIRQLQQRALYMQSDFTTMERILNGTQTATLHEALSSAVLLVDNVVEFTKVLERRSVFFTDSRVDRKRYEENIEQIRIITKDTRYSLERQHYINLESLLDDVQVLKRYLLITIRQVFEKMVRVIVESIETGRCDLMLRANINMIATLTNIDYDGFASLTDAFVQNEAVRALLVVCLDNKLSSVRALALRALATICCAPAAIAQLGTCGGIEIVRDILHVQGGGGTSGAMKRGDMERREAVSLLTQITAAWHGPDHRVDGLKACAETIVEGLTQLVVQTSCGQTLLLCAAALNNLSRIEITSHYSIMSNEAIFKLIETVERRDEALSIFLYEQIVAMLHNMSLNKKCHSHLANGSIINFITSAYQTEFYKSYDSRAESDAQRRTIKAILHMLTRLVHDSSLGMELLEQQRIPDFFKMAMVASNTAGDHPHHPHHHHQHHSQLPSPLDNSYSRDISLLARQLLLAQKHEQQQQQQQQQQSSNSTSISSSSSSNIIAEEQTNKPARQTKKTATGTTLPSSLKFNLTRQESYV